MSGFDPADSGRRGPGTAEEQRNVAVGEPPGSRYKIRTLAALDYGDLVRQERERLATGRT